MNGIKTLLFAGGQVAVADSDEALKISVHKLETFISKCGLKISKTKTETVVFKVRDTVRNKTVINTNNNIEQINAYCCLDCSISYKNENFRSVNIS
jgi:hypothetical protein